MPGRPVRGDTRLPVVGAGVRQRDQILRGAGVGFSGGVGVGTGAGVGIGAGVGVGVGVGIGRQRRPVGGPATVIEGGRRRDQRSGRSRLRVSVALVFSIVATSVAVGCLPLPLLDA